MIVDAQTQKIGGQFYWQLGQCDDTEYWEKDIKYDNAMSCLTEIAKTEEDYMFTFDQSTFPWTLNFISRNATVLSEFRLRRNTESCVITLDDSDLCTRLYLSVSSENEDDEGAGTYFDEGYYTFNDTAAQAIYGIVCKTAGIDQSVFSPTVDLEAWKDAYFARHNTPNVQITIDGMELNRITGDSYDEMHLGRICQVALPDYNATYAERIVSVNYPDALRKPNYIRVSLHNKRETAEDAFAEISSTASSAASTAKSSGRSSHNDATYFRRTIGDTANGLYSRIEQTAYYIRSEVVDIANGLYSRIEQTASYIRSEVANTANGLYSRIEQTASYIRSEVSDTANGLSTRIEQNSSQISLRVMKGYVATQLAVEAGNVSITNGNLVVDGYVTTSALSTQLASITQSISQSITTNTFSCVTGSARDFTVYGTFRYRSSDEADPVSVLSAICGIGTAQESSGHFTIPTTTIAGSAGPSINFNIAASQTYIDGVAAARRAGRNDMGLSANANDGIVEVVQGSTKSLAITASEPTFTYSSSGHYYRATASALAGSTVMHTVTSLSHSGTQAYTDGKADGHDEMGLSANANDGVVEVVQGSTKSLAISATAPTFSYSSSTHKYTATAKAKAGSTKMHTATAVSGTEAFEDGVSEGESHFTQATVTPQGDSESVYIVPSSGGTDYYQADSAVTYYKGDGTRYKAVTRYKGNGGSVVGRGDSETVYVSDSSGSYYLRGDSVTRYSAGENKTYYLRKTSALKLVHDGQKTYYVAPTGGAQGYNRDWYYVDSGGTSYYQSDGSANVTLLGSSGTYYKGNGTRLGRVTRYKGNGDSVTARGDTESVLVSDENGAYYTRGNSVSVTPIKGSALKLTATTRYKAGTPDSSTYYTKNS